MSARPITTAIRTVAALLITASCFYIGPAYAVRGTISINV
jgi:hypothetical protein